MSVSNSNSEWQRLCLIDVCVRHLGTVKGIGQKRFGRIQSPMVYISRPLSFPYLMLMRVGCLRNEHKLVNFFVLT